MGVIKKYKNIILSNVDSLAYGFQVVEERRRSVGPDVSKMRLFKKLSILLSIVTIVAIGVFFYAQWSAPSAQFLGDYRDYFPMGTWYKAVKLNTTPAEFVMVYNDSAVAAAIAGINESRRWDWVEDWMRPRLDSYAIHEINDGYVWHNDVDCKGDFPPFKYDTDNILWVPDGNYYRIEGYHIDGIPVWWNEKQWWRKPPAMMVMFGTLGVLWIALGVMFLRQKSRSAPD